MTKIVNARVFDGTGVSTLDSVSFENGVIVEVKSESEARHSDGTDVVDAAGCTLMPALIDAHVHLYAEDNLRQASRFGVGTMLDMGVRSPEVIRELEGLEGVPQILSGMLPGFGPNSTMPVSMKYPDSARVKDIADAERFVREQVDAGAAYIKVILEEPRISGQTAFDEDVLCAIVASAHGNGRKVVAHSVSPAHFALCAKLGIDVVTHIPFFRALAPETVSLLSEKGIAAIPTMGVMKGIAKKMKWRNWFLPIGYRHVKASVKAMHQAGLLLMAGTDSNAGDDTTPCEMPYGVSLHDELALMVEAGFSCGQALASATGITADFWGLNDRGRILPGRRADLLLVKGNPTSDIKAIRNVAKVWLGGNELM